MRRVLNPPRLYRKLALATPGLQSYRRLGERAGTVMLDELGINAGAYVGSPTLGVPGLVVGSLDTAVTFNGSTQWATFPYTDPGGDLTLLCRVRMTTASGILVVIGSTDGNVWLGVNAGAPRAACSGVTASGPSITVSDGATHVLGVTVKGVTVTCYTDGIAGTPLTAAGVRAASTWGYIARHPAGFHWPGTVDEHLLINRGLSPAEMAALSAYRA